MSLGVDSALIAKSESMGMLVGGKLLPADSGKWFEVLEPATGDVVIRAPDADGRDIERAYQAASRLRWNGGKRLRATGPKYWRSAFP